MLSSAGFASNMVMCTSTLGAFIVSDKLVAGLMVLPPKEFQKVDKLIIIMELVINWLRKREIESSLLSKKIWRVSIFKDLITTSCLYVKALSWGREYIYSTLSCRTMMTLHYLSRHHVYLVNLI
jgi:hypothetical protein